MYINLQANYPENNFCINGATLMCVCVCVPILNTNIEIEFQDVK